MTRITMKKTIVLLFAILFALCIIVIASNKESTPALAETYKQLVAAEAPAASGSHHMSTYEITVTYTVAEAYPGATLNSKINDSYAKIAFKNYANISSSLTVNSHNFKGYSIVTPEDSNHYLQLNLNSNAKTNGFVFSVTFTCPYLPTAMGCYNVPNYNAKFSVTGTSRRKEGTVLDSTVRTFASFNVSVTVANLYTGSSVVPSATNYPYSFKEGGFSLVGTDFSAPNVSGEPSVYSFGAWAVDVYNFCCHSSEAFIYVDGTTLYSNIKLNERLSVYVTDIQVVMADGSALPSGITWDANKVYLAYNLMDYFKEKSITSFSVQLKGTLKLLTPLGSTLYDGNQVTKDIISAPISITHSHIYPSAPTWAWTGYTAKATFSCPCGDTKVVTATVSNEVTTEPTCMETGIRTYTAKARANASSSYYTNTKTEIISVKPHTYVYSEGNGVIEEHCTSVCGHSETATISGLEEVFYYSGTDLRPCTATYSSGWAGDKPSLVYSNVKTPGLATVSLTVSGITISKNYTIEYQRYNIIFNKGSGTGTTNANGIKTYGTDYTVPSDNYYSRVGYTQVGWQKGSEGGTAKITIITENSSVTLYPVWSLKYPTITGITSYSSEFDGSNHNVTVSATHELSETYPLTYQWCKSDGTEIPGATSASFAVSSVNATGQYYCEVRISNHNQTVTSTSALNTVAITKAQAEITVDQTAIVKTYGDTWSLPSATSNFGTVSCDKTVSDMRNVNTYVVTYAVAATDDYFGDTKTLNVTINRKTVTVPADAGSKAYTGTALASDIADTADFTVKTNIGGTDVEEYDVVLKLTDKDNLRWASGADTEERTIKFSITQATNAFSTALSISGWTYGDSTTGAPSAVAKFGTLVYTYSTEENGTYIGTAPTNADTYWVKATVAETTNYTGIESKVSFVIAKAKLAIPTENTATFTYLGVAQTYRVSDSYDSVKINASGNTQKDAVVNKEVTFSIIDKNNYEWEDGTVDDVIFSWTINKQIVTPSVSDVTTKPYDGNKTATGTIALNGAVNSENPTASGTFEWTSENAETTTFNVTGITLGSAWTANYKLSVSTFSNISFGSAKIAKADSVLDSAPSAKTLTYSGLSQALINAGTASGGILWYKLEDGSYTTDIPTAIDANETGYTVFYKVIGDNNHNDIAEASLVVKITKYFISAFASDHSVMYGDAIPTYTVSFDGFLNEDNEDVLDTKPVSTCLYDTTTAVNAGPLVVYVSGGFDNNYAFYYFNDVLTISPKNITVTAEAKASIHKADLVDLTFTFSPELFDGDNFSGELATTADKVTVGEYDISQGTLSAGSNYSITFIGAKYNVTAKANISIVETAQSHIYDKTAKTFAISGSELTGFSVAYLVGDSYTTTAPINAGSYKVKVTRDEDANIYAFSEEIPGGLVINAQEVTKPTEDTTIFVADGTSKSYTISVDERYVVSGNEETEFGSYTVTVALKDKVNYSWADGTTASLTFDFVIRQPQLADKLEETAEKNDIIVTTDNGFVPDAAVSVKLMEQEELSFGSQVSEEEQVAAVFDVKYLISGTEVQPDGKVTVKILIPENCVDKEFRILNADKERVDEMQYIIDGDYAIVTTEKLSEFVFVTNKDTNLLWQIILLAIFLEAGVALALDGISKRKKR